VKGFSPCLAVALLAVSAFQRFDDFIERSIFALVHVVSFHCYFAGGADTRSLAINLPLVRHRPQTLNDLRPHKPKQSLEQPTEGKSG
jgi:hypothetical protein